MTNPAPRTLPERLDAAADVISKNIEDIDNVVLQHQAETVGPRLFCSCGFMGEKSTWLNHLSDSIIGVLCEQP